LNELQEYLHAIHITGCGGIQTHLLPLPKDELTDDDLNELNIRSTINEIVNLQPEAPIKL